MILILSAVFANARQITTHEARSIASAFLNSDSPQLAVAKNSKVKHFSVKADEEATSPYYVFNSSNNQGFVIVSGDDQLNRILGYSDSGTFDFDNLPPQLEVMLELYSERIESLSDSKPTHISWLHPFRSETTEQSKLLETANWGQGYPYNLNCPMEDDTQCPTGCVATAMAIVMKYHNWPESYNWENMPSEITGENADIASLMQDIGTAVDMKYALPESSTNSESARYAFAENFNYSNAIQFIKKKFLEYEVISDSRIIALIKEQIDRSQPCLFSGGHDNVGHMFVCDGYDGNLIHINWGWEGVANGYFNLMLDDETMVWNEEQALYIDIKKNDGVYSKVFIDASLDYDRQMGIGLNVRNENIRKGEPIEFVVASMGAPLNYSGSVTLAIIDQNENIKELVKETNFNSPEFRIDDSKREWQNTTHKFHRFYWDSRHHNYFFEGDIRESDMLVVVAKEDGDSQWRIVPGTAIASNMVPAVGNTPKFAKININNPDGIRVSSAPVIPEDGSILLGQVVDFGASSKEGIPSMIFNGFQTIFVCNQIGMDVTTGEYYVSNQLSVFGTEQINIEITLEQFSDLITKEINLDTYNTLPEFFTEEEKYNIGSLTITGKLSPEDYVWAVENLPYLLFLDIEKTDLTYLSTMPTWLKEFRMPETLETIYPYAFSGKTTQLYYLEIPSSVKTISSNAFYQTGSLGNVIMKSAIPPVCEEDAFQEFTNLYCSNKLKPLLFVPNGSLDAYSNAPGWSDFYIIAEYDPNDIGYRKYETDEYNASLICGYARIHDYPLTNKDLIIPDIITCNEKEYAVISVEMPLEHRYDKDNSIEHVNVPGSVKAIGMRCFDSLTKLKKVKLSDGLEVIEMSAFSDCYSLEEIYLPTTLKFMNYAAFRSCHELKNIYYPTNTPIEGVCYDYEPTFEEEVYDNATLYVPLGAESAFREKVPWKYFANIKEVDFSGISDTQLGHNNDFSVFGINGECIKRKANSDDINSLPHGLYIIKGKKILIK